MTTIEESQGFLMVPNYTEQAESSCWDDRVILQGYSTNTFSILVIPSSKFTWGFHYLELCQEDSHHIFSSITVKITLLSFRLRSKV